MDKPSPRQRRLRAAAPLASLALAAGLLAAWSAQPPADPAAAVPTVAGPASSAGHGHRPSAAQGDAAVVPARALVPNSARVPASQVALRQGMRLLWVQHMEWTRMAVVDFAAGSPGFGDTAGRLLKNQEDIGDAIRPYYGDAAGDRLTVLLKEHITEFVGLFQAAEAGDAAALAGATDAVHANAREIADFLSAANPQHWPQDTMRQMMKGHIDQTIAYGGDQLAGRYGPSISGYDRAEAHMVMLADALSDGLVKAFPQRFR